MTQPVSTGRSENTGESALADEMRGLAQRAYQHFKNRTTDQAPSPMQLPVEAYLDEARYKREFDRIFTQLPLGLALSVELPGPGSYLAREVCNVPVLVTRDENGKARAFLNVCRHRGATICPEGAGKKSRFVCPYHSWAYAANGELTRINAEETFGEVDRTALGLTELACAEKSGVIWVALKPGSAFDIDDWLGDFSAKLDSLDLGNWYVYDQRTLASPGWKATFDGYLEVYHHDTVHGRTVGQHTVGNLLVHDTYGPHQRLTFGRKTLEQLDNVQGDDWDGSQYIRIIHSVFPNLSISGIIGGHCLVSQVFPGESANSTITRQTLLCAERPETEAQMAAARQFSAMTLQAVRDEDYVIAGSIQRALGAGANTHFVIGRNEPGLQHFHRSIARFMQDA
ncbi:MAG: aromatic ring-hydroxylating dioxygenase subunit alpha [Gammaproteobacteria bacterium]|nr:aromatic ring-hydroxylating dioxygenase subunit alpha [Gammaproteobacteria bacterium]